MGRFCRIAIVAGLLGLLLALAVQGEGPNLIQNGSFEGPFINGLATGWGAFSNGGRANYGWYADDWKPVVYDGQWSQLISINTKGQGGDADRFAGIYQTVDVKPGQTYRLTLHGLIRSTEGATSDSGWGYRLQWAVDLSGGANWQEFGAGAPVSWQEIPWAESPRLSPGRLEAYTADITASSSKLTLFIRAWKKWGNPGEEGDFNIDGVSLVPVAAAAQTATPVPVAAATQTATPVPSGQPATLPATGMGLVIPVVGVALGALALGARRLRRKA